MATMVSEAARRHLQGCPIEGCRNYRDPRHYLCAAHWRRLPVKTKQALRLRDGRAITRLKLLWEAIDGGIPLGKIYIVDPSESGLPDAGPMLDRGRLK